MKSVIVSCVLVLVLCVAVSMSAQAGKATAPNNKEIAGRWVGSVTADAGEMGFGLELNEKDGKLSGALETAHGNWTVTSAAAKDGAWTLNVKTEDGSEGKLTGRVKNGTFAGDWNFVPRAVGTFELTRPQK
jgi:hypothetical protein